jgi:hypothetical protein
MDTTTNDLDYMYGGKTEQEVGELAGHFQGYQLPPDERPPAELHE